MSKRENSGKMLREVVDNNEMISMTIALKAYGYIENDLKYNSI